MSEAIQAQATTPYEHWVGSEGLSFGRETTPSGSTTSSSSTERQSPKTARRAQPGSTYLPSPRTAGSSATTCAWMVRDGHG
jgi:hypothetical protein